MVTKKIKLKSRKLAALAMITASLMPYNAMAGEPVKKSAPETKNESMISLDSLTNSYFTRPLEERTIPYSKNTTKSVPKIRDERKEETGLLRRVRGTLRDAFHERKQIEKYGRDSNPYKFQVNQFRPKKNPLFEFFDKGTVVYRGKKGTVSVWGQADEDPRVELRINGNKRDYRVGLGKDGNGVEARAGIKF